jgi:hypothetical protein
MVWEAEIAAAFKAYEGVYALPGECWGVLTISPSPAIDEEAAMAFPEGYAYTWSILAPGEPPKLRGHRMAGIDNSDDTHVRKQIKADPARGRHRAHVHEPNFKEMISIRGQDWPVHGKGDQLPAPPKSPTEFWLLCLECLEDAMFKLGLPMPTPAELYNSRMTKEAFAHLQKGLLDPPPVRPKDRDPDPENSLTP